MQVTRKDYVRIYRMLQELPALDIKKNIGTQLKESLVTRSWTSSHNTIFNKNKAALKALSEEMIDWEKTMNISISKFRDQLEKSSSGEEKLSEKQLADIKKELVKIGDDSNTYFDTKVELPDLLQIEEQDIEGWELTGSPNIGYFWDYLVKYKEEHS